MTPKASQMRPKTLKHGPKSYATHWRCLVFELKCSPKTPQKPRKVSSRTPKMSPRTPKVNLRTPKVRPRTPKISPKTYKTSEMISKSVKIAPSSPLLAPLSLQSSNPPSPQSSNLGLAECAQRLNNLEQFRDWWEYETFLDI